MPTLVAGIHASSWRLSTKRRRWAGTSPAMRGRLRRFLAQLPV